MSNELEHIVTVSYMGSGSSAVTDLLREYANIDCPNGSYEYIFLHCPNGIFDLEDKLLCNNNALRSDEALRTFRQTMLEFFENPHWWFGNFKNRLTPHFMKYVDEFLDQITTCSYNGFWYEHEKTSSNRIMVARQLAKLNLEPQGFRRLYSDKMHVSFPSAPQFYSAVNTFFSKVLGDTFKPGSIPLLDQLFLPHSLNRINNYFPHTKYLLVKRDPRDVFVLNKYIWTPQGCPIPFPKDVETFCIYYAAVMESTPEFDTNLVMSLWFEDLILEYDSSIRTIEGFLGETIGAHVKKGRYLDPSKSIRNIGVYLDDEAYAAETEIISTRLAKYLYPKPISAALTNRQDTVF